MRSLIAFFKDLIGHPDEFTEEQRLLHFVVLLSYALLAYAIVFNLLFANFTLTLVFSFLFFLGFFLFYLSRYLNQYTLAWSLLTIITYGIFIANYFLNDGLNGPTLLLSFITIAMLFSITPFKFQWLWVTLHIFIFGGLVFFELENPDWVTQNYPSAMVRALDNVITYSVTLLFMATLFRYIMNKVKRQRRDLEEQQNILVANKEVLELSNIKLNQVFGIVAHDIRSPLGSIQSFLEYLSEEDLDEESQKEIHEDLYSLVKQTSSMVDNLLHWSTQQISGIHYQPADHTLGQILNTTIDMQKSLAESKNIQLITQYDPSEIIYADKDMIQMAIRNLLQNAIKFSHKGGRVWFQVVHAGGNIDFIIKDEGIGIPESVQKNLFTIQTSAQSGTENEKGVGLGLMLCKEVADAHKGRIILDSQESKGTTLTLRIPF
jgi:signal transduction histidine kinase